jgi:uncharacterized protein
VKDDKGVLVGLAFDATKVTPEQARNTLKENGVTSLLLESLADHAAIKNANQAQYFSGHSVRYDGADAAPQVAMRHDAAQVLAAPEELPNGFVRAQGLTTRFGVFTYRMTDGSTIKELRPPEEVMDGESLRSFDAVPVTIDHPTEEVDPRNVRALIQGVSSNPTPHQDHVAADVVLYTQDAKEAVRSGRSQLSYGYRAEIHKTPGVWTNADGSKEPFDTVQRKIRGNHLALVEKARAGDLARLHLDGAGQIGEGYSQVSKPPEKKLATKKITIAGQHIEVDEIVANKIAADEAEKAEANKARDQAQGKADALEAQMKANKLDSERKASDEKALNERIEVATLAAPVLKKDFAELVKMNPADVIKSTVAAACPNLKLDGKSPDYIRAIFDQATSTDVDTSTALRIAAEGTVRVTGDGDSNDPEKARQKMIADAKNRGRTAESK